MMPVTTGLDLVRAVRAERQICDVPIVLMSGAQAEIERSNPDLFQAVVNKPCDKEMLLTGICGLMKIAKIEEGSSFRFTRRAGTVGA